MSDIRFSWRFTDDGVLSNVTGYGAGLTIKFARGGADITAFVPAPPAGTYYEILGDGGPTDLLEAVEDAMNLADTGAKDIVVDLENRAALHVEGGGTFNRYGNVRISSASAPLQIKWTSAHTFPEATLGFTAGVDRTDAGITGGYIYSQNQHQRGWWPPLTLFDDGGRKEALAEAVYAGGGAVRGHQYAEFTIRTCKFDYLYDFETRTTAAQAAVAPDLNRAYEVMWSWMSRGERVRLWPDVLAYSGSAEWVLARLEDRRSAASHAALMDDAWERYLVQLMLRNYVAT